MRLFCVLFCALAACERQAPPPAAAPPSNCQPLPGTPSVSAGAPVRLDGVEIGNVETVRFAPRTPGKPPDKMHNIELGLRVDRKYQNDILSDSSAMLVTEGLLGNRYVNITRGYTGVPLKEGQEVPGARLTQTSRLDIR